MKPAKISDLIGKTLASVEGLEKYSDEVHFKTIDGEHYRMCHHQNCCESVAIGDLEGTAEDLIDTPILSAEEVTSDQAYNGLPANPDSFTWTFYRIGTAKNMVVIRWLGESNGYYSERVDFDLVD